MNHDLLIGALRQGKTGDEILQILEILVPQEPQSEEVEAAE
jgi:hypothetical protein